MSGRPDHQIGGQLPVVLVQASVIGNGVVIGNDIVSGRHDQVSLEEDRFYLV
jgi:hypothetical protein